MWQTSVMLRLPAFVLVMVVGWVDPTGRIFTQSAEALDRAPISPKQVTFRILGLMKTKSGAT